jgi:hypothetical protein
MSVSRRVAEILREHVTLQVECVDRLYLNAYVPRLQYESGVAGFFRHHRGHPFASSALMDPISKTFVAAIHAFVEEQGVPLIAFAKGQRKDDVMAEHLKGFTAPEGVVFVGRAQEKTPVLRTEKRRNPATGQAYPWLVRSTAMVNHFYVYAVDEDFGPFFLKFGTYFPYNAKLCLNGHEYVKRQLAQRDIAFEALDNGILSCADRGGCRRCATGSRPTRLTPSSASGCGASPIPSPGPTARRGIGTSCPSCRPSSASRRCWIAR